MYARMHARDTFPPYYQTRSVDARQCIYANCTKSKVQNAPAALLPLETKVLMSCLFSTLRPASICEASPGASRSERLPYLTSPRSIGTNAMQWSNAGLVALRVSSKMYVVIFLRLESINMCGVHGMFAGYRISHRFA